LRNELTINVVGGPGYPRSQLELIVLIDGGKCCLVLLVLPLILKFGQLHFIREDGGGGTVLTNEAYFFMYDCPGGFVFSVPEYLAEPIREYF
jgi:hypothetical protein